MFVWRLLRALIPIGRGGGQKLRPGRRVPVQVVRVQDGDSLIVRPSRGRNPDEIRLRLYAIDAPEMDQQYGREAREYLGALVRGRDDLILEPVDTDRYGRLVGILSYRREGRRRSINRAMVEQGMARWYSSYGGEELGVDRAEQEARRRRRGIWSSGEQVAPWDHRRAQRERPGGPSRVRWLLAATALSVAIVLAMYLLRQAF